VKGLRVGITGSPATGKKTVGKALGAILRVPFLNLNELATGAGYVASQPEGEPIFDARGFSRAAERQLPRGGFVVSGVFLSEAIPSGLLDYVVVLRCNPLVLSERYVKRGYSARKRKENLTAEFLDTSLAGALAAYGDKVREVDTSGKDLATVVKEARSMLEKGKVRLAGVDWLSIVKGPDDVFRFMV
jgi:adenylate kinase